MGEGSWRKCSGSVRIVSPASAALIPRLGHPAAPISGAAPHRSSRQGPARRTERTHGGRRFLVTTPVPRSLGRRAVLRHRRSEERRVGKEGRQTLSAAKQTSKRNE